MSEKGETGSVFISYARADAPWAEALSKALANAGVRPWLDSAEILPGEPWEERIQEQLRKARIMVVLLTPASLRSSWTYFEVGAAVADRKTIIPVLSHEIDPSDVPSLLRTRQWVTASSPAEAGEKIARAVKAAGATQSE
jgi:TIR domain